MQKQYKNLLAQAEKIRRHNRQGSYKTKKRYFEAYKRFLQYLAETYRLEKIANISGKHLSSYVGHMQNKGLAASTIKTDLAAIRFWHDKISDAKYDLPSNDEFKLERRKFGGVDRTWSKREYNLMIAECMKAGHIEFEACIVLAYHAGLRIHEVMRIDTAIARAALKNGYITIKGKGGKIREVPINEYVRVELEKMIKQVLSGQKLFVESEERTHLTIKRLQNFIRYHRSKIHDTGLTKPLTFHGLRHTYAAEAYQKLIDEGKSECEGKRQVSQWLGHERGDVTNIYLAGLEHPYGGFRVIPSPPKDKDGDADV